MEKNQKQSEGYVANEVNKGLSRLREQHRQRLGDLRNIQRRRNWWGVFCVWLSQRQRREDLVLRVQSDNNGLSPGLEASAQNRNQLCSIRQVIQPIRVSVLLCLKWDLKYQEHGVIVKTVKQNALKSPSWVSVPLWKFETHMLPFPYYYLIKTTT